MCNKGNEAEGNRLFLESLYSGSRGQRILYSCLERSKIDICLFGEDLDGGENFCQVLTTAISWSRISTLHAAIWSTEHSAFFASPNGNFTAARAWKFHCAFSRQNCASTPRARRHAYDFFTHCGCRTHHLHFEGRHAAREGYKLIAEKPTYSLAMTDRFKQRIRQGCPCLMS